MIDLKQLYSWAQKEEPVVTKMDYLDNLREIAETDVKELRRKEQTYQGSWKKRGGTGAFMMLARKWDRIENIAEKSTYDIFGVIHSEGLAGEDGTLVAEIRDLRRYLMLVEAYLLNEKA